MLVEVLLEVEQRLQRMQQKVLAYYPQQVERSGQMESFGSCRDLLQVALFAETVLVLERRNQLLNYFQQ